MILLDTDHFSFLTDNRGPSHATLVARIEAAGDEVACTIVSAENVLRGWLAYIHKQREVHRQLSAYERLAQLFDALTKVQIVRFERSAADEFVRLRREGIRIGSMDLKIASIALVYDALVLTANLRDFSHVPGLRCEDWLQE